MRSMSEYLNYIERNRCVISGNNDLEHLHTIENFPVYIGCTEQDPKEDIFADMEWHISRSSGAIQLKKLLPLEIIYPGYHSEAVGQVWDEHHRVLSEFISKNINSKKILEMGGSNGKLVEITTKNLDVIWEIIEPNPDPSYIPSSKKIKVDSAFIEDKIKNLNNIENFVHSHVLEHLYNPIDVLKEISSKQKNGNRMIFSVPNLLHYLQNKYANSINFEHTYFLTDELVVCILNSLGYKIIDKYFFKDHSIFYSAEKSFTQKPLNLRKELYSDYTSLYLEMINFFHLEAEKINKEVSGFEGSVFLFGAHIFSQFLLHNGLRENKFKGILDNSKFKQGKRLYGTSLNVFDPSIVKDAHKVMAVVKAGQYQSEVEEQLLELNSGINILR